MEGSTEIAFKPHLLRFLAKRLNSLGGKMPTIVIDKKGHLTSSTLSRDVQHHLMGSRRVDHVIALTDVYTGKRDFRNAADARSKMTSWVGSDRRFQAHAAQYEFEAWLLPYWSRIQELAGSNRKSPPTPELVNHNKPPSHFLSEVFRSGSRKRQYSKVRDASKILDGQDLGEAAAKCPELKAFLNTILRLSGGKPIP